VVDRERTADRSRRDADLLLVEGYTAVPVADGRADVEWLAEQLRRLGLEPGAERTD
jgi:hypothetical protein